MSIYRLLVIIVRLPVTILGLLGVTLLVLLLFALLVMAWVVFLLFALLQFALYVVALPFLAVIGLFKYPNPDDFFDYVKSKSPWPSIVEGVKELVKIVKNAPSGISEDYKKVISWGLARTEKSISSRRDRAMLEEVSRLSDALRLAESISSRRDTAMPQKEVVTSGGWEYHTIERLAPKGQYVDIVIGADTTSEASARLTFWYKHQTQIMQLVQPYLDDGWEPVTEIGPGCILVTTSMEHSNGILQTLLSATALAYNWWMIGLRIELRRRKRR